MALSPELLLEHLKNLAGQLGIEVRCRPMDTPGGLCRVRDRRLILLNQTLSPEEKIDVLASALPLDEIEGIHVPPAVREAVERAHRAQ